MCVDTISKSNVGLVLANCVGSTQAYDVCGRPLTLIWERERPLLPFMYKAFYMEIFYMEMNRWCSYCHFTEEETEAQ